MTTHKVIIGNSNFLPNIADESVDLIVTSPPYPMIEMWDSIWDATTKELLHSGNGYQAFLYMHDILNSTWKECDRVLKTGGFVCINIGDATRTINGNFQLYPNHTKVIEQFSAMGYSVLPDIHWRKQTNAPNKFMGSGMYPAGAYVTYEHEYILIFRKGGKRVFNEREKRLRQKSAYFWEERNVWFSDLWDIKGTDQIIATSKPTRSRNASYPLEIPYRLIRMYSIEGDTVLDPFFGLGTTGIAAMISNRNSIGVEIDSGVAELALDTMNITVDDCNQHIMKRLLKHVEFINSLPDEKKSKLYHNIPHGFDVKTRQETAIHIEQLRSVERINDSYVCKYEGDY